MGITSDSVQQTIKIGKSIAKNLKAGDILCLFGELGSGKTVLVKGIAKGLGVKEKKVISPTFVLIQEYSGAKLPLYHFDLYRLKRKIDILGLGYEEYFFGQGVTVIEWADRLGCLLPQEFFRIDFSLKGKSQRLLKFRAVGQRYQQLMEGVRAHIGA